jgi:hypothetical protein
MLVEHEFYKKYLLGAVSASPAVFEQLLEGITQEEIDRKPDPERFSIREIMAHLADWEPVLLERIQRTRDENEPTLAVIDPGQLAIDHDYAHANFNEQVQLFGERRAKTAAVIADLNPTDWQRTAVRPNMGAVTMESLVAMIPLHDLYHLRQVAEWRKG